MLHMDSYRVLAGRIMMHVRDWPGDGPPIVFLHGFTNNSLSAQRLGKLLGNRRRLLAPDLRGRGLSDVPFGEYGMAVHQRDVTACLDALNVKRCILAGHSFGATLAIFLATSQPERIGGLILFDGGAIPGEMAIQALDAYYSHIRYTYPSIDGYIEPFKTAPTFQPYTEELDIMIRSNLYQQPDGTYIRRVPRYVVETDRRADNLSTWQTLPSLYPKITCPVLIIRAGMGLLGPMDQVLPDPVIDQMVQGMSGTKVTVTTIESAGHTSLLTIPNEVRDHAILDFLGLSYDE